MDMAKVRAKFGDDYTATERTFVLGIDTRITAAVAERFRGHRVLETCAGAGFTTIALAKAADHVTTIEIDSGHLQQARLNVQKAGVASAVTLIEGDALSDQTLDPLDDVTAAFLDPDWAVSGPNHVYRFRESNTRPPADELLQMILARTANVALILAPYVDTTEFEGLPPHELQSIYLDGALVLYCLYFGRLATGSTTTELRV